MSATTLPASVTRGQSWAHGMRLALLALVVVVLLAVSFAIGRATTSTSHRVPTITPTAGAQTTVPSCRIGRPC